jgi:hypothetical protein
MPCESQRDCTSAWGDAYYVPSCPYNLISFRSLIDLGYCVACASGSLEFTSPSGLRGVFSFEEPTGLYLSHVEASASMVVRHFTAEQKRALLVRE